MTEFDSFVVKLCHLWVELPGFEPGSKQDTHKLSTCLFCYWFSILAWEQTPEPKLIFCFLARTLKQYTGQPEIVSTPNTRWNQALPAGGMSRSGI